MRVARAWQIVVVVGVMATALSTPAVTWAQTPSDPPRRPPDGDVDDARVRNQFLVDFVAGSPGDRSDAAAQAVIAGAAAKVGIRASVIRRVATGAALVRTEPPLNDAKASDFLDALVEDPSVAFAEPDGIDEPTFTPNDPRYPAQWHYHEAVGGINLPTALDKAPHRGGGVTVAVLDTGVAAHPDLDANVIGGYDFITSPSRAGDGDGRDPNPNDEGDWAPAPLCPSAEQPSTWHGTHVAGTIAAVTDNGVGVAGVAPGAKVEPLRVMGHCGGIVSDLVDAIVWAAGGRLAAGVQPTTRNPNPAEVINMSLGDPGACFPGSASQQAINMAVGMGATVVVGAGNSFANTRNFTPGSCANVITVAGTDRTGRLAWYSNFGAPVDVCAPGGATTIPTPKGWVATPTDGVLSTFNSGETTQGVPIYHFSQGTSMAAPHVAGVVALMLGENPGMTPAQVEARLKTTARVAKGTCLKGRGIIDAGAAVGPPRPALCTTTTSGNVTGLVVVASGQHRCLLNANVSGAITVDPGGELTVTNSVVGGGITSNGARALDLCASLIGPASSGPALSVTTTTGPIRIGDPSTGCAGNNIRGAVSLTGNAGGLVFGSNYVQGGVTVAANQGGPNVVERNVVTGALSCAGNNPAPTNNGNANTAGSKAGQCGGL